VFHLQGHQISTPQSGIQRHDEDLPQRGTAVRQQAGIDQAFRQGTGWRDLGDICHLRHG
jgi:hypothetical protein